MRQLSPSTNLVLAALSALGLLSSLTLPWYAPPFADHAANDGPVERTAAAFAAAFRANDGAVTGSASIGAARTVLVALAVAVVVLAAMTALPAARAHVRDLLRGVALAAPAVVLYLAFARPGAQQLDVHWGLPVALALATFMASSAWWGGEIRVRRAEPGAWARSRPRVRA